MSDIQCLADGSSGCEMPSHWRVPTKVFDRVPRRWKSGVVSSRVGVIRVESSEGLTVPLGGETSIGSKRIIENEGHAAECELARCGRTDGGAVDRVLSADVFVAPHRRPRDYAEAA